MRNPIFYIIDVNRTKQRGRLRG